MSSIKVDQEKGFNFGDLLEQDPERNRNPFTERKIKINGQTYKKLRLVEQLRPESFDEAKTLFQMKIKKMRKRLLGPVETQPSTSKSKSKAKKCPHDKRKYRCRECDYPGYCYETIMREIRFALIKDRELPADNECLKYLDCDIATFKKHIEEQFTDGMSWNNRGGENSGWEIDHCIPFKYNNPTAEEKLQRLHYTNLQPLPKDKNLKKSNKYVSKVRVTKGKVTIGEVEIEGEDITINFSQDTAE